MSAQAPDSFEHLRLRWENAERIARGTALAEPKRVEHRRRTFASAWPWEARREAAHLIESGQPPDCDRAEALAARLFDGDAEGRRIALAFLDALRLLARPVSESASTDDLLRIAGKRALPFGLIADIDQWLRRGEAQRTRHQTSFRLLFDVSDQPESILRPGLVGTVTLELRPRPPGAAAKLYPSPALACLFRDAFAIQMADDVCAWLATLPCRVDDCDFRWQLEIPNLPDGKFLNAISGDSAGLMFALGAAQCLVREGRLSPPHPLALHLKDADLDTAGGLAALNGAGGKLKTVGGHWPKLNAAAEFWPRVTLVLAAGQLRELLEKTYAGLRQHRAIDGMGFHFADSVEAAAEEIWRRSATALAGILDYTPSWAPERHPYYHPRPVVEDDLANCIAAAKTGNHGIYWALIADAFFGKSAFSAHIFPNVRGTVVGHFFKEWPGTSHALGSVPAQLRRLHPEVVLHADPHVRLYEAFKVAGEQARRRGEVQLVVFDGLDEATVAPGEQALADLLPKALRPACSSCSPAGRANISAGWKLRIRPASIVSISTRRAALPTGRSSPFSGNVTASLAPASVRTSSACLPTPVRISSASRAGSSTMAVPASTRISPAGGAILPASRKARSAGHASSGTSASSSTPASAT
jgi:hypothetical protein